MKNQNICMVIVLVVVLVVALGYIAVDKYTATKQQEQLDIFQQGAQLGYQQAILQIIQQAATCQQVPLFVENQTINLIAVECLQQTQE